MGYHAHGNGILKLNDEIPEDVMGLLSHQFDEIKDSFDGGLELVFELSKYYKDVMNFVMNKVAPYVESGDVDFIGEDDDCWRYHFNNGTVEQQEGKVVYVPYKSYKQTKMYRVVFMRKSEEENPEHDYYFDGVSIEVEGQSIEDMFVDLINKFEQYVDENNIEDVSVNEIYEVK